MPEVGSEFLGFRLLRELGRGAFGRVFLAQQGELANRPVALKVAANQFGESQTLAQLQHTNVVPIYSVHRTGPLQAVCMPYSGSTALEAVHREVRHLPSLPETGKVLVSTIHHRRDSTHLPGTASGRGSNPVRPSEKGIGQPEQARPSFPYLPSSIPDPQLLW